jgi:hypothetical protein
MAHAQKPYFVFRRNGRVHLNRQGRQFSRLPAAEVCASAVVILDTPCSEVVWRVLATHSIRQFPLLPCVTVCHHVSTELYYGHGKKLHGSWTRQSSVLLYPWLQFTLIQASTSPKSFPLVKAITGLSLPTFMWTELSDSWRWIQGS